MKTWQSMNPATGMPVAEYPCLSRPELDEALDRSASAAPAWRARSMDDRGAILKRAAELLRKRSERLALLMTSEMGKPVAQSRAEVEKCAWVCEFYAEHGADFAATRPVATDASSSAVRYEPLGCVLAIMPWNFPLWQVFRFAAPVLMLGNVALLKHAPNVPGCALACEAIWRDAGAGDGVFQSLLVPVTEVERMIADSRVHAISVTGSERAGAAVASRAGVNLKPCLLELGGSDPFVVLSDCDIDEALTGAVTSRTLNNGQSCIAAKRFIIEDALYDEFVTALDARMRALVVGDPMDPETDLGPMARRDLVEHLHHQVTASVAAGARLRCGGGAPPGPGFFYLPTVLADVVPGMAAFDEETFGPVASCTRAEDTDHAVELANQTRFGLGASLWSRDPDPELISRLSAGHVAVNGIVKSDPRLPFGGIRNSGFGRELGREGMLAFANTKSVWVR